MWRACRLVERGWARDAESAAVAQYVARRAFEALEGAFASASKIRAWFKACARTITKAQATVTCVPAACCVLCSMLFHAHCVLKIQVWPVVAGCHKIFNSKLTLCPLAHRQLVSAALTCVCGPADTMSSRHGARLLNVFVIHVARVC